MKSNITQSRETLRSGEILINVLAIIILVTLHKKS